MSFICQECGEEFEKQTSIYRHASRLHNLNPDQYVIKYDYKGIIPLCACGCGQKVNFYKKKPKKFVHSHASNNLEIRQKMIEGGQSAALDPLKREKNSLALKKLWEKGDYRDKMLLTLKFTSKVRTTKAAISNRLPENRLKMSLNKKAWYSIKENLLKMQVVFTSDFFKNKVSEKTKIALDKPEIRLKLSTLASKNQANGIIGPNLTKRSWMFNPFINQQEHFDSGWEEKFLIEAIKRNIPIKRNRELFLPYQLNEKNHIYIPDFITLSGLTLIEIKGMKTEYDIKKIEVLKQFCIQNNLNCIILENINEINLNNFWLQIL